MKSSGEKIIYYLTIYNTVDFVMPGLYRVVQFLMSIIYHLIAHHKISWH